MFAPPLQISALGATLHMRIEKATAEADRFQDMVLILLYHEDNKSMRVLIEI